ncbi:MAG TPA: uroporphyrinogen-III C-methyltransferase [Blastocatellia bacterium]|nr:uroporphyrinogen-III C-methyltransferase [Blastocatellia bacterium]
MDGDTGGKVYLIGAGPGDPKLLTLRAAEAISASDVIVYDYLVNPEVLVHAKRGVELIYAGKRAGEPSISQEEINQILIENARAGRTVARLKGGDPFIFGRGGEEAEALAAAGIAWEVVPGISSGIAAAAYAGIPLTHREHSSSVAFITGHDGLKNREKIDWRCTARAAETLVIFMCGATIAKIARDLIEGGRPSDTPIAIIRWGTYEHQEVYSGTLEDLTQAESLKIAPPAIAIVGDVVALRDRLRWFGSRELEYPLRALAAEARAYAEIG